MSETKNLKIIDTLSSNGFPLFAKELSKVSIISLDEFIDNHDLAYFNDTQEGRNKLGGDNIKDVSLSDAVELYEEVALPKVSHIALTGSMINLTGRIFKSIYDFMYKNTAISSITAGARESVNLDSILTDLCKNSMIKIELLSKSITDKKSVYGLIIYDNQAPILGVEELEETRKEAESLSKAQDKKGLMQLFDTNFVVSFLHDTYLIKRLEKDGMMPYTMLVKPEKPNKFESEELKRNLLLSNIYYEYNDYIKPSAKFNLYVSFFSNKKEE